MKRIITRDDETKDGGIARVQAKVDAVGEFIFSETTTCDNVNFWFYTEHRYKLRFSSATERAEKIQVL